MALKKKKKKHEALSLSGSGFCLSWPSLILREAAGTVCILRVRLKRGVGPFGQMSSIYWEKIIFYDTFRSIYLSKVCLS